MGEQRRHGGKQEGGEESGRGREKGGVIVGGRGGDSLVDGQKRQRRGEGKRYINGLFGDKLTDACRQDQQHLRRGIQECEHGITQ